MNHDLLRGVALGWLALGAALLSPAAALGEIHVAKNGNDVNAGDSAHPLLTINRAAQLAQPGDTITVHAGVYRERVTPARGGTVTQRIVYQAAPGEAVAIKGSEVIATWTPVSGGVWTVTLPDTFFGAFNPYTINVSGSYLGGTFRHLGCVYLNDEAFLELQTQAEVQNTVNSWFTSHAGTATTLVANFGAANPNTQLVEINVRPTIFFPSVALAVSSITVQGFTISHAATQWAPPDAIIQEGAIGSLGGAYWIIQNCTIRYSRNVGISLGNYNGFSSCGGNPAQYGHHLIRNNIIQRCGQAGIAGDFCPLASRVVNNLIEDIDYLDEWFGYEQANIKFHNTCDVVLEGNLIRQKGGKVIFGVWMDWANINTRFTRNIIEGFQAIYQLEEDHGPFLFDNNIFIGGQAIGFSGRGVVGAHNLYVGVQDPWGGADTSRSPGVFAPHTVSNRGNQIVQNGFDDKRFNNVYVGTRYSGSPDPGDMDDYDLYLAGAVKDGFSKDTHGLVFPLNPNFTYTSDARGFAMSWDPGTTLDSFTVPLLNSDTFGVFQPVGMRVENPNGSTIVLDHDFFGNLRNSSNPRVGPFASGTRMSSQLIFDASLIGALAPVSPPTSPCDVNADGLTTVVDVQQDVNAALGVISCTLAYDINKDALCNVLDVQRVVNAALGGPCVTP